MPSSCCLRACCSWSSDFCCSASDCCWRDISLFTPVNSCCVAAKSDGETINNRQTSRRRVKVFPRKSLKIACGSVAVIEFGLVLVNKKRVLQYTQSLASGEPVMSKVCNSHRTRWEMRIKKP
ncbi:Uncharacterised protein [Vibrio cholerae]|nr:Uncharacterised protein [Vibrio cholerae]